MSVAAAIAFVVGTAITVDANKASQRASKRRAETVSASQKNADAAALRQQARETRKERARVLQASQNLGTVGSSKEAGAIADISGQQAASFSNVSAQQLASAGISAESQKMADANTRAGYGQVISKAGAFAFSETGGFDSLFSQK